MKRKSIWLLTLFLAPFLCFSQAEVTLGKPYKVIDAADKYYFHKGDEILTLKKDGKIISIQKLNAKTLSFIQVKVYEDMPSGFVVEKIAEFSDRYYVFYSLWDKANEAEQLFYREIDFAKGVFIGDGKLLLKVNGKVTGTFVSGGFYNVSVVDKFSFNFSKNDLKMLIQYRMKPVVRSDDKSFDVIGLCVFDKNIQAISKKEVKMPYSEKKMNNLDYSVDSEGNAYILTTVYDDNTTEVKGKDGKANYHIELLRIKANTSEVTITPVVVKDKFINKIWLYENAMDYMVCAGFYNNGKDLNDANGIFLFKVGKDGKVFDMASYEIPVEVLNQFVSKRSQKQNEKKEDKGKAEFTDLELRELIIQDDGSLLLVGEQYYMESHTTYSSNGGSRTYYTYHYNDMLVTKIDPSGKLSWMKKLPKRQTGRVGKGGMSYQYMYNGDSHTFLFLDNQKNMNLPLDQVPAGHSDGAGGFLTAYKVKDGTGAVTKISILDTKDVKGIEVFQFLPSRILPLSNSEFVLEVYKKKKEDIMIKVNLGK